MWGGRRGESDVEVETDLVVVEAAAAVGSTVFKSCYCSKSKKKEKSHVLFCSQLLPNRSFLIFGLMSYNSFYTSLGE